MTENTHVPNMPNLKNKEDLTLTEIHGKIWYANVKNKEFLRVDMTLHRQGVSYITPILRLQGYKYLRYNQRKRKSVTRPLTI